MIELPPVRVARDNQLEVLRHFAKVAHGPILTSQGRGACMAASRITIQVLRAFDFSVRPVSVKLSAGLIDGNKGVHLGFTPEELKAQGEQLPDQTFDEHGWNGHLVVVAVDLNGSRWLLDPSFDQVIFQLNGAGARVHWKPKVEFFRLKENDLSQGLLLESAFLTDCGQRFGVQYISTGDNSYQNEKNWNAASIQPIAESIHKDLRAFFRL